MRTLLGAARLAVIAVFLIVCTPIVLIAGLLHIRFGIAGLANWLCVYMARFFDWLFNVKVTSTDTKRLYEHQGFITPNHSSYLDIVTLTHILPLRFMAAIEVKRRPFIGWLAQAIDTVFVDRTSLSSRRDAVNSIAGAYHAQPDPPIVIFPEGRLGLGDKLFPFKLGTFKLAQRNHIAYLPVAIDYQEKEVAVWKGGLGEKMLHAVWRLACFPGPLHVTITPLAPVLPEPDERSVNLADSAQYAIEETLGLPHQKPETTAQKKAAQVA
ncbi:MAG: 1-acyl-sn-glycerol-3-phosphate acyltransferase [Caldilineaceae bacterium]|nr:1-acyl-sn-glycerol-3-phosphate acyltransferase [Caldilineaceae bacterium]